MSVILTNFRQFFSKEMEFFWNIFFPSVNLTSFAILLLFFSRYIILKNEGKKHWVE
jgi:hypothetical protein